MTKALRTNGLLIGLVLFGSPLYAADRLVKAGEPLQPILDTAQPGDVITLESGATFSGNFVLRGKTGTVTLTSTRAGELPVNVRVTPAAAPLLAKLQSPNNVSALDCSQAMNWIINGLAFGPNQAGEGEIAACGRNASHVTFSRILIDIPLLQFQKRGIRLDGKHMAVRYSHLDGFKRVGQDSQAVAFWDGAGPYDVSHNYLGAVSENLIVGGADSSSLAEMPCDITITNNHFEKQQAWMGKGWNGKNLLELKVGCRVKILYNTFRGNWPDAQTGSAILFTVRNQDGKAPWSQICDVEFGYNDLRDVYAGFQISGYDNNFPSQQTCNIRIHHTLVATLGGRLGTVGTELKDVTFDHVTFVAPMIPESTSALYLAPDGDIRQADGTIRKAAYAAEQFTLTNSLLSHHHYGVFASSGGEAGIRAALKATPVWQQVVFGVDPSVQPPTYFPSTTILPLATFTAQFDAEYRLVAGSPFKGKASDGSDLGWGGPYGVPVTPPPPQPPPVPPPAPPPPPPPIDDTEVPQIASVTVARSTGSTYRVDTIATDNYAVAQVVVYVDGRYAGVASGALTGDKFTAYVKITKKGTSVVKAVAYDVRNNTVEAFKDVVR